MSRHIRMIAHRRISRKACLHTIYIINNGDNRNHDKDRFPADFVFSGNIAHKAEPDECRQPQKSGDIICCCHLQCPVSIAHTPLVSPHAGHGNPLNTTNGKSCQKQSASHSHTRAAQAMPIAKDRNLPSFSYYPLQSFHAFRSLSSWKYDSPHPQKQLSVCCLASSGVICA